MFSGGHQGINGNPCLATAETGEKVYGLTTEWVGKIIKNEWQASYQSRK
jgi:hypothetical protein